MEKIDFSPQILRSNILEMAKDNKSGHLGCAMSLVEIMSSLFSSVMKYDPSNPHSEDRDVFALSKGHGVMGAYAAFYQLGWIKEDQIKNYLKDGTDLFGLSEDHTPGMDVSGGSLGHGLAVATGMAYGLMRKGSSRKVFCIVGDGELNEGSMWEAILFAGHHKLDNLIIVVDANQYQAMGLTKDIIDLEPLDKKFESFKFSAFECDGHSVEALNLVFEEAKKSNQPSVVIARTTKGAGVSFMEGENIWHYKKMSKEEEAIAFSDILKKQKGELK